jgi:hypothetical protein
MWSRIIRSKYRIFWELCIDISGNIIFILHAKQPIYDLVNLSQVNSFSGMSDDEIWEIECTELHFLSHTGEISHGYRLTFFYLPSSITLKIKDLATRHPNLAKAYFSNFKFSGIENEGIFFVNINSKIICFEMLENSNEIIELINIQRISNAITSQVSITINQDENIDFIKNEITSISWFLSLLNLNLNFTPIIEYYANDEVVRYDIENTAKNTFNDHYIIDNFRIDGGIPKAFNDCYANYKTLDYELEVNKFIGFLAEINQQKYIEIKFATMIMAYEYLLFKYLSHKGENIGDNIQQKLRQLNKHLRFIPNEMMDDTLRGSVRNPLFHQGEIPLLSLSEKRKIFKSYYDLLIKIILIIIGYKGEYMSIVTHTRSPLKKMT